MLSLLSCGSNAHGQLGLGTTEDTPTYLPCRFSDDLIPSKITKVTEVAAGANHTLILVDYDNNGSIRPLVLGCGDGRQGQLGDRRGLDNSGPMTERVFHPINIPLTEYGLQEHYHPKCIAATWETSFVVFTSENLGHPDVIISFGSNEFGDLGIGHPGTQAHPRRPFNIISFDHLWMDPGTTIRPETLKVVFIMTGQRHVIVKLEVMDESGSPSHRLEGWGASRHGQLGQADTNTTTKLPTLCLSGPAFLSLPTHLKVDNVHASDVVSVAMGIQHSVLHLRSGKVVGLGSNRKHQIDGLSSLTEVHCVGATWNSTLLLRKDDVTGMWGCGSNSHGQLGASSDNVRQSCLVRHATPYPLTSDIMRLICGSEHVLVFVSSQEPKPAELWAWGWNEHGNLGLGDTVDRPDPVQVWATRGQSLEQRGVLLNAWAGMGTSWILLSDL